MSLAGQNMPLCKWGKVPLVPAGRCSTETARESLLHHVGEAPDTVGIALLVFVVDVCGSLFMYGLCVPPTHRPQTWGARDNLSRREAADLACVTYATFRKL